MAVNIELSAQGLNL